MNVIRKPKDLVFIWASLKRGFEGTISEFMVVNAWSWKAFAEICQESAPTCAYYWAFPTIKSRKGVRASHRSRVTRLILRTAKEFWLPRRELIEDDYMLSINESFAKLPPSKQAQERQQLAIATRISKFKRRLGGFYLLWALYWNQPGFPDKKPKRIEITAHDYGNMKAFEKELKTVPIPFMRREDRMKLIEQVQFMMNQFVHNMAYDVCLFAEEYDYNDIAYLNTKYSGKAEILEWEKSSKERLLFHPKIRDAFVTHEKKVLLERQALKYFDKDFIDEALEFLKNRARGKARATGATGTSAQHGLRHNLPRVKVEDSPSNAGTSCTPECDESEDPKLKLARRLILETLKSPYSWEDLIPPVLYRAFVRAERKNYVEAQAPPIKPKSQSRKSKHVQKKPATASTQIETECGNVDNLAPVLQAIGLASDLKPQLDPVLREYFTMLFKGRSAKPDEELPQVKPLHPPEWNFIYKARALTPKDVDDFRKKKRLKKEEELKRLRREMEEQERQKALAEGDDFDVDIKLEPLSPFSRNEAVHHMPSIDTMKTDIKREPVSPPQPNDLDLVNECEKAMQNLLSPPRSEPSLSLPIKAGEADSEAEEANVEEILEKLTSFPGLLGELKKTPKKRKRKASLKIGNRASKFRKLSFH